MKRYQFGVAAPKGAGIHAYEFESPEGEWVRYEDCMAAINYVIHELNPGLTKDDEAAPYFGE